MNKENMTGSNIPEKFLNPYDSGATEDMIYKKWEESGFFNPDKCIAAGYTESDAEHFSMVLPPPNVTGQLHIGHAAMLAIEDIMVRFNRMRGKKTLWIPGTDHAAIATQSKVEKNLSKQKIRRQDLGREKFLEEVQKFALDSQSQILSQVRRMGASVDWSRLAFTLDEDREKAVFKAFKEMYEDNLLYQGERIVNWDPKGQTVISDDEIVRVEEKTKFYYFQYGPFIIGTARPETKFGDKYVVVHPDDKRYEEYKHGETFTLEWINGTMKATLIKDDVVDMSMGTGAMTITPWHSQVDFELAQKHNLDMEQIIDQYGKLLPIAQEFAGMKINEARAKIVEKLEQKGLLVKVEDDYVHQLATAERTGGIIEPQIMKQWFIDTEKDFTFKSDNIDGIKKGQKITLKEVMLHVVRNDQIKILPDRFEKVYFNWIENLRPWNISRQIWYGHRIPVWYKGDQLEISEQKPGEGWEQDPDTLDTWFSSGLWTFSTLGWPEKTDDLATFHPTSVLETGYDIIFFWVARMILMTTYLLGDIPFKTVYLHGLVRDGQGRKISKSLGNNIDPVDYIEKYGADALRMALIIGTAPGQDAKLGEDKTRAYKKFANKLWNVARFILESTSTPDEIIKFDPEFSNFTDQDKTLLDEQQKLLTEITQEMEDYKFYLVGEKLYHYVWHELADKILEESKTIFEKGESDAMTSRKQFLLHSLHNILKALHPFMPYITEEIWQLIPDIHKNTQKNTTLLMVENWPV